ncbi:hypothetical protein BDW66DRAFT_155841 [Aspergillus desertorum]
MRGNKSITTIQMDKTVMAIEKPLDGGIEDSAWEAEQSQVYTQTQHALGFWEAVRLYQPAVLWSLMINVAVVLKGFDGALVGSIVGLTTFKKQFGYRYNGDRRPLRRLSVRPVRTQDHARRLLCAVDRLYLHGVLCRDPRRPLPRRALNGTVIAFYPIVGSAYIGEVCPLVLRGVAGSMVNLGFVVGQLIASAELKGTDGLNSKWAYKARYASQWAPALLILSFIAFCPNSPWWLCRKGRIADAREALAQATTSSSNIDIASTLANIQYTLRLEHSSQNTTATSTASTAQALYVNYAVQFFERANLDITIGPTCFTILTEIPAVQLRGMTIGLATVACHVWNIIFGISIPYAIDQDQGNWRGKVGFLFAGIAVLCSAWCWGCLPETRGRTFDELDVLFEKGLKSREFESYGLDKERRVGNV